MTAVASEFASPGFDKLDHRRRLRRLSVPVFFLGGGTLAAQADELLAGVDCRRWPQPVHALMFEDLPALVVQ